MSIKINIRHSGDVAILDLGGRVTWGESCGLVRQAIKDLVTAGDRKILLNLRDVAYIDSAGLGELAGSYATLANLGGQVKLLHPQGKVSDLLAVTRLYSILMSFHDEAEALHSFETRATRA